MAKTGVEKGDSESYVYDAAGNATSQTIGSTTSTMTYDRNRLVKTVSGATTMNYRYDVFGRSTTTDVGAQVVEQNAYDGYDRLVRQQKFDAAGTPTLTRNQTYDPFDRVSFQSEKLGTAQSVSTRYSFVGLADQVASEEERDSAGTWKVSKSYAYGAGGENLSLVDSPVNTSTSKKSFYGVNPHGDVETLTDATTGQTTSTYRYTAYGQADKVGTTGDDAIMDDPAKDADVVNPYRFNSKRFDGATGTYDMGFREYNPGLNRFLTRDMYAGALGDMALGADPWNANRYMFAGGNPISRVELDGHINALEAPEGSDTFVLPISTSDEEHNQQVKENWKNAAAGAVEGTLETNEMLPNPVNTVRRLAGTPSDSQIYHNMLTGRGVDTESAAYQAGKWFGLPLPAAGVGVRVTQKTAVTLAEKAAVKLTARACSFSGDTSVEMADGSRKDISQIKIGDEVLATDPETGERGPRRVTHLWVHPDTLLDLEVEGGVLTTTEDHPFWNATDHEFQRADQLDQGDQLLTPGGQLVRVIGIRPGSQHVAAAYNLTVDGIHTYYVLVGANPVLVHNTCIPWSSSSVGRAAKNIENGATGITVRSRSEAEELFLRIYQGHGYQNASGFDGVGTKQYFGSKVGTYHWDDQVGPDGRVLGHGPDNVDGALPHLQVHTFDGPIVRIFWSN